MKQFNFERAFDEAAKPAHDYLHPAVKFLFILVKDNCADLVQSEDLSMPWPDNDFVKASFTKLSDELLAGGARVVYSAGHWAYADYNLAFADGGPEYKLKHFLQDSGAYWKFSNYADQILRERMDIVRDNTSNGMSFNIIEGMIRVQVSTKNSWNWIEVCLATSENLHRLKNESWPDRISFGGGRIGSDNWSDAVIAHAKGLVQKYDGYLGMILDTERYMEETYK